MKRSAGVIMHISSLPGKYGIGTFGKSAYDFGDFLKESGLSYWQILPLGQTTYGDSPYQSFSAFGGNPYFIDYEILKEEGLLEEKDYEGEVFKEESIDYGKVFSSKYKVLKKAYRNFKKGNKFIVEFEEFQEENKDWIYDYGLYMGIKESFGLKSFLEWDEGIKRREEKELKKYEGKLLKESEYWRFLQFLFFTQWKKLKSYVNSLGIKIIGDLPIYVSEDSADMYCNKELFLFDEKEYKPLKVSGCPPDAFSDTGQLWGNPIYNWEYHKSTGFKWWIKRIKASLEMYDVIRIDHFRGFEAYWEIPYGDKTAEKGEWVKGPGKELFEEIKKELGDIPVIAEDLGYITDEVRDFRLSLGYPGMKVMQFGFDGSPYNSYLPHNYERNTVVYTGTHDNDTILGWFEKSGGEGEVEFSKEYLSLNLQEGYNFGMIRGGFSSVAELAITTMQDFLSLGHSSRMNTPSTLGGNWSWRMKEGGNSKELSEKIRRLVEIYGRI